MKKFKFSIEGNSYEVSAHEVSENKVEIEVNGTPFTVEIEKSESTTVSGIKTVTSIPAPPPQALDPIPIKSPLPGVITEIVVKEGQKVNRGDVLLVMESMKMENNITADRDGVVKTLHVSAGETVMQDDILIDFEGTAETPAPKPKAKPKATTSQPQNKAAEKSLVRSPLPGVILKIITSVGANVKRGDVLLVMESMKMENNIIAENDGVIKSIKVEVGQTVMQGDILFDIN